MDGHEGITTLDHARLESLVSRDRVHRSVYTDPDIFELEMKMIFGRAWIYVGHESQVPNTGDFITSMIGRQPVVMSRHTDGKVYVIYNSCGHRGAIVCNEENGTSSLFRCCYHGWTFKTNGDIKTVAMPRRYSGTLKKNSQNLGMGRLPRVDTYRGFVFASLAADGPSLETHLGFAAASIDDIVDRAPDGEIEVSGGVHKYMFRGNWKLQLENSVDSYHGPFSHESTLGASGRQFSRSRGMESGSAISERGKAAARWEERAVWGAGATGHSFVGHQPVAETAPSNDPDYTAYVALLEDRHGSERAAEILRPKRHNTAFFPNLAIQALNHHIRVIRPVAVDRTEVRIYPIKLKGAPEELNRGSIRHLNLTHAAASLIQTDDLECFRRCQEGVVANSREWVWFARGIEEDAEDEHGDYVNHGTAELPQRSLYAGWINYMSGQS